MKTKPLAALIALAIAVGLGSGCVLSIGGSESQERHEVRKSPPAPPPVVVMPPNTEDSAVIAEIDAAGKLSFDDGKANALRNVASRPSLSPPAQVHLVNTALRVLSFDASRVSVLQVLIQNPGFSPAAKEAIFRQLERLDFDGSKTQVMNAIQQRSATP